MTLYLNISNQAKRIVSYTNRKTKSKPAMVILNTDDDFGKYPRSLAKLLKDLGLTERSKFFRSKKLNSIETGDFIVIGEETPWEDFDFQVVEDQREIEKLDGRKFRHVYDIIDDWKAIVKKLAEYGNYNNSRIRNYYSTGEATECFCRPAGINVVTESQRRFNVPKVTRSVSFASIHRPAPVGQKVTIFDNWVKIGMSQFDINVNLLGEEYIRLSSNQKLYVVADSYGRKYLVKR